MLISNHDFFCSFYFSVVLLSMWLISIKSQAKIDCGLFECSLDMILIYFFESKVPYRDLLRGQFYINTTTSTCEHWNAHRVAARFFSVPLDKALIKTPMINPAPRKNSRRVANQVHGDTNYTLRKFWAFIARRVHNLICRHNTLGNSSKSSKARRWSG